jgi:hypothetical protein
VSVIQLLINFTLNNGENDRFYNSDCNFYLESTISVTTNQNEMKLHKKCNTISANSHFKNIQLQNNVHFRLTNTAKLQVPTLHPYTENSGC